MIKEKVRTGGQVLLIPIGDILPPEEPVRKIISSEEIEMLARSIETAGLLTPLTVTYAERGLYRVISGERRRLAALKAGISAVPCLVMNSSPYDIPVLSLVGDIHKKELHFLESAEAIEKLRDFLSVKEISERLSIPEGMVLSRIRLLSLPENIKWKIISGNLSESTANNLCKISDISRLNEVTDLMFSGQISFNEAMEITDLHTKKTVFTAHFKDYRVFENTIEHAIDTMTASGISASVQKNCDDEKIIYTITIDKMVKR